MSTPNEGAMMQPPQGQMMQAPQGQMHPGGHLYMQTNEVRNCIIHYFRAPDGTITEVERVFTGGAGSGVFKPVSGQASAPNAFEGAYSVILTPDRRFLFTTNGGDNSVSSFAVGVDGKLTLLDAKRTGNIVDGRSGTAKALAYSPSHRTLFVLHAFGDHLRLMSVDDEGKLTARPERYTVNTTDKPHRVATMAVAHGRREVPRRRHHVRRGASQNKPGRLADSVGREERRPALDRLEFAGPRSA